MKVLHWFAQQIHINGLPTTDGSPTTLANVFGVASAVAGGMSVLFILIGAIKYAISAGDPGQMKQARDTILYSLVGLVVSTSAFLIVQFVLGSINNP